MSELVVVATCYSVAEAHILRGMLESVEVPAMLRNEYIVGVQWMYTTAVGGVDVVVPAPFAQDAVRVLRGEAPLFAYENADKLHEKDAPASDGYATLAIRQHFFLFWHKASPSHQQYGIRQGVL